MSYQSFNTEWSKPFLGSYSEEFIDDDLHDEADYGGNSHRPATTKSRSNISYTRRAISKSEKDAITAFVKEHRTFGYFYWTNQFTAETLLVRFKEMPKFTPITKENVVWDISISLEEV